MPLKFAETELAGAFVLDAEYHADVRGGFARTFCSDEFAQHAIIFAVAQCATSFNARAGTLRGLHFQDPPHSQAKLVRVTAGSIYDVIVDLRQGSPTWGRHVGAELSAANRRQLFIPKQFAHGFVTLVDDTEVFYQFDEPYAAGTEGGIVYSDPDLAIAWPHEVCVISERDRTLPNLSRLRG